MKSLAVYCGSSPGSDPIYAEQARTVGTLLAQQGITVIYGGGHVGLMGEVADATLAAGGKIIGVITEYLKDKEVGHSGLTELQVVDTMQQRKTAMIELADAFVALPGSTGTLEEIFEVIVATQLGLHEKPCGFLNTKGYYDPLLAMIDRMVDERFLRPEHRDGLIVSDDPADLIERMATAEVRFVDKWLDRD